MVAQVDDDDDIFSVLNWRCYSVTCCSELLSCHFRKSRPLRTAPESNIRLVMSDWRCWADDAGPVISWACLLGESSTPGVLGHLGDAVARVAAFRLLRHPVAAHISWLLVDSVLPVRSCLFAPERWACGVTWARAFMCPASAPRPLPRCLGSKYGTVSETTTADRGWRLQPR